MKTFCFATLTAAALAAALPASADPMAGFDRLTIAAAHRTAPVAGSVWYPAGRDTYRSRVGDNPIFVGEDAMVGAAMADGKHPLIVLSHGSGGNMDGLAWLGSRLALRGAIVLAVNHQGSTSGDSSPRRSIEVWNRPADLTAALDQVLADPQLAARIDTDRISVLGFSLGGATALHMGGLRMDRAAFLDYCETWGDAAADCLFFAKGGVDLASLPPEWEGDFADPRVDAVIAVDPAMGYAMTQDSIAAADLPFLLLNLGDDARWAAIDVGPDGSDLAARLVDARYQVFAPANHYTFLAVCTDMAPQLLIAEGEDPICDDPEGTDRAAIHDQIVDAVAGFLNL